MIECAFENYLAGFRAYPVAIPNGFDLPYRVSFPKTGCGFVFIVPPDSTPRFGSLNALQNLTLLHKYEQKLSKCIGTIFSHDGEFYDIDWCYIDEEWAYDSDLEQILKENFPFRPVREKYCPTYQFDNDLLP